MALRDKTEEQRTQRRKWDCDMALWPHIKRQKRKKNKGGK